ncbi:MAG TPA: hypothetical protein PK056_09675 [Methylotenera sp.]|nr:hypothetical protein [Methylotenera sp.]
MSVITILSLAVRSNEAISAQANFLGLKVKRSGHSQNTRLQKGLPA